MEVKLKFLKKSNFDDFRSGTPAIQDVKIQSKTIKFKKNSCSEYKQSSSSLKKYKKEKVNKIQKQELKTLPKIKDKNEVPKVYKKEHFKWLFKKDKRHHLNSESHKIFKLISKENQALSFDEYQKKEKVLSIDTFFAKIEQDSNKKRLADTLIEFYDWARENFILENNELDPIHLMKKFIFDNYDKLPISNFKEKSNKSKFLSELNSINHKSKKLSNQSYEKWHMSKIDRSKITNSKLNNVKLDYESKRLTSKLFECEGVKLFIDFYKAKNNERIPFSYT